MRFLSIVKSAENQGPPPQALLDAIAQLTEDSIRNGSLIQTGGLCATSTGARVRVSGGKLTVTDGPFTEAKEVVGGYAVLEAKSRDEALEAARTFMRLHQQHWPGWDGECEIRELVFLAPGEERSEEHTSELQSPCNLVCRLLLEKKKKKTIALITAIVD